MAEDTDAGTDVDTKKLGLWLRLISNSHMVEKEVRNLFRSEYGVTLPRFDLMSALFREPGGLTMGLKTRHDLSKEINRLRAVLDSFS